MKAIPYFKKQDNKVAFLDALFSKSSPKVFASAYGEIASIDLYTNFVSFISRR